ncbi:MAG: DUF4258 domain-containing protein [Oligoflexales bacterium]|nr:DUF4258 domain-containing protein [Oligoflexales bacterium]
MEIKLRFTKHALEKSFQRNISPLDCEEIYRTGEIIEIYPDDLPFPSELRLAKIRNRYLHLVTATQDIHVHVITAYEPDPDRWDASFKKRRKSL